MLTISQDLRKFSDGCVIEYNSHIDLPPSLSDEEYKPRAFGEDYKNVLFGDREFKIKLNAGIFERTLEFQGPTPIWEILTKIYQYFRLPITQDQYAAIYESGEYKSWNRSMFPTWESFKNKITMIGQLKGDHVAWAGLENCGSGVYSTCWSS
jgi:hypothetical protein